MLPVNYSIILPGRIGLKPLERIRPGLMKTSLPMITFYYIFFLPPQWK